MKYHDAAYSNHGPAESPPQQTRWPQPGELWSLGEMLSAHAATFLKIVQMLQGMERIKEVGGEGQQELIQFVRALLPGVRFFAETFKWRSVAAQVERVNTLLNSSADAALTVASIVALRERIEDELAECMMWFVESRLAPYHDARAMFGTDVAAKFPDLMEDIEAAGECLSLSQGTASVFHLMRAMEGAVGVLCTTLSIPNPDREWGKLLSDLHKGIDSMQKGARRDAWSAVHANLYHVKQAWRNGTMHPKQTYTVEQAEEVFLATKTFMRHLAGLV